MKIYDPSKVGARIAWGRSHSVYRYGDNEVIRFPTGERLLEFLLRDGLTLRERFERDIALCEKYFGEYFLHTRIVGSTEGVVATIQPLITGHYLSKKDLHDEPTKQRFQEFVARYEALTTTGYVVDLIGQGGVFRRCLSNIYVLPDGNLKLFDAAIVDSRIIEQGSYIAQLITKAVLSRQCSTLTYLRS